MGMAAPPSAHAPIHTRHAAGVLIVTGCKHFSKARAVLRAAGLPEGGPAQLEVMDEYFLEPTHLRNAQRAVARFRASALAALRAPVLWVAWRSSSMGGQEASA